MNVDWYVSESDLNRISLYDKKWKDTKTNEALLFQLGLDVDKYYISSQYPGGHYNFDGDLSYGRRFEGYERTDKDWVKSKYISYELVKQRVKDIDNRLGVIFDDAKRSVGL